MQSLPPCNYQVFLQAFFSILVNKYPSQSSIYYQSKRPTTWLHVLLGVHYALLSVALLSLFRAIITVFQPPVHDVPNHRCCQQAQQLQYPKNGSVETHCREKKKKRETISNRKTKKTQKLPPHCSPLPIRSPDSMYLQINLQGWRQLGCKSPPSVVFFRGASAQQQAGPGGAPKKLPCTSKVSAGWEQ